jgi:putative membrane protein
MRSRLLPTLALAGSILCMQPAGIALAQHAGGTGGSAAQTPSSNPNTPGLNTPNDQMPVSSKVDDKKFLNDAAVGGMTEVELGKLAVQKASNDAVKQFGQKMVDDHTAANNNLKDVAGKESVNVPDSLDSKHQARIDKLSKLSGEQFDKAYVKDQLKDHETDVRDFQTEAQNGTDPGIKTFAAKTLPTLQQHLAMVKDLNKSMK